MAPARKGMQVVRGLSLASATVAFVAGARTIDFADAIAILYAYPFLLTVLAATFLGERVRWVGWLGVVGGFVGGVSGFFVSENISENYIHTKDKMKNTIINILIRPA